MAIEQLPNLLHTLAAVNGLHMKRLAAKGGAAVVKHILRDAAGCLSAGASTFVDVTLESWHLQVESAITLSIMADTNTGNTELARDLAQPVAQGTEDLGGRHGLHEERGAHEESREGGSVEHHGQEGLAVVSGLLEYW